MQSASQAYKESMKQVLRERGYLTIYLGVVNLEAQKHAAVNANGLYYLSNTSNVFTGQIPSQLYAVPENDYSKTDGTMYFVPEDEAYYNQGAISNDMVGNLSINLGNEYDLGGMTILFGDCYPTEFTITTDNGTVSYTNDSAEWHTDDTFIGISYITVSAVTMVNGQGRLRILQFTCGISITIPTSRIQSYTFTGFVSPIAESLPTEDMKFEIFNDGKYNLEDVSSVINFFETGQLLQSIFSYDVLGDSILEYITPQIAYLQSVDATDDIVTFTATDRFKLMNNTTYYKGLYRANGITLYALAVDVLQDAGLTADDYSLDPYLQNIVVYNPLPICGHAEALQIIANAGRCALMFNRDGKIRLEPSFMLPDITVSATNQESWSNVTNILTTDIKQWYATPDYAPANESSFFKPSSGYTIRTGFVSKLADANGDFTSNPVISLFLERTFTCYGIKIGFQDNYPGQMIIRTYSNNVLVRTISCAPDSNDFTVFDEFTEFDKMTLEISQGQPQKRVMINYLQLGDVTDYALTTDRDLLNSPKAKKQDKIQAIEVTKSIYTAGTELKELTSEEDAHPDADGYYTVNLSNPSYGYILNCDVATIVESSCWYVKMHCNNTNSFSYTLSGYEYTVTENQYRVQHNPTGIMKTWKNELISSTSHAADLEEWLADYYLADMEYELEYRGDPRIDANDLFYLETSDDNNVHIRGYSNTLKYDGTWEGAMKARKVVL